MQYPADHKQYQKLGGIINEKDYESALSRAENAPAPTIYHLAQLASIARAAGIELLAASDPRTVLYSVLRRDTAPESVLYHHSNMSDQRLFAEVLRMLQDADSLEKLILTHPHINFN